MVEADNKSFSGCNRPIYDSYNTAYNYANDGLYDDDDGEVLAPLMKVPRRLPGEAGEISG